MNAKNESTKTMVEAGRELVKDAETIVQATAEVMQTAEAEFLRVLGLNLKTAPTRDIIDAMDFLKEAVIAHAAAQFTLAQVEIDQQCRERAI